MSFQGKYSGNGATESVTVQGCSKSTVWRLGTLTRRRSFAPQRCCTACGRSCENCGCSVEADPTLQPERIERAMPRHRVLVTAPYMQQAIDRFLPELEAHGVEVIVAPVEERLAEDELLSLVGNIDGVICGDDRFTERVLSHAPRLRVIAKWGTGIDSIDVRACRQRGIAVCNTPRAFTDPVADSCLATSWPLLGDRMRWTQQ